MGYSGTPEEQKAKRRAYDLARHPHLAQRMGAWRDRDRAGYNAYMREYRRNNPEPRLLMEASYRAKKRGLDFNLSLEDIIIPSVCPVFGLPFVHGRGGGPGDQSATLDRVDSTKGYVKGNVWVISGKANRFKNNATLAELKQLVAALEERLNR